MLQSVGTILFDIKADSAKLVAGMDKAQKYVEKSVSDMKKNIISIGVAYISVETAMKGMEKAFDMASKALDVTANFEKMSSTLKTLEGSSANAQISMKWIQDFASTTPYELKNVTEAFVKLRSYGLDPTHGLLKSLGDTSSAMGKDLNQAVEAMADAVTGENERLKEFGIRASKTGDQIKYSWTDASNQTKEKIIQNNSQVIQSTLEAIFNEKYGGAMIEQATTWNGMVSNMQDRWTLFQVNIMNSGLFDYLKALVFVAGEYLQTSFKDSDEAGKAFSSNAISGIEGVLRFGGFMYDTFKAIGLIFDSVRYGAEVAFYGIQVITSRVTYDIQYMFEGMFNFIIDGINNIINMANSTGLVSFSNFGKIDWTTQQGKRTDYLYENLLASAEKARASVKGFADVGEGQNFVDVFIAEAQSKFKELQSINVNKIEPSSITSSSIGSSPTSTGSKDYTSSNQYQDIMDAISSNFDSFSINDLYDIKNQYSNNVELSNTISDIISSLGSQQQTPNYNNTTNVAQANEILTQTQAQITQNTAQIEIQAELTNTTKDYIDTIVSNDGLIETYTMARETTMDLADTTSNLTSEVNKTIEAIDSFIFAFSDTLTKAFTDSAKSLEGIFSTQTTQNALSYAEALELTLDLQRQLVSNPLDTTIGAKYKAAYDSFLTSSADYLSNTSFQTYEQMRFAQAQVGIQTAGFQTTASDAYNVLDSMNNLLSSINDAFSDGILTQAESTALTSISTDINSKNTELMTNTKFYDNTGLATNSSLIGQNSVSDYISKLMGSGTSGISLTSIGASLPALSVATGLDVSKLSNIATNTSTTATNVAASNIKGSTVTSLDKLQIKSVNTQTNYYKEGDSFTPTGTASNHSWMTTGTSYTYYANGGYTGDGLKNTEAGIVHKGEYVLSQEMLRAVGGISAVESFVSGDLNSNLMLLGKDDMDMKEVKMLLVKLLATNSKQLSTQRGIYDNTLSEAM